MTSTPTGGRAARPTARPGDGASAGALIGAAAIGLVNASPASCSTIPGRKIITYLLLYATLLVRPHGLLGRRADA